jgi:hypothetical protein
VRHVSGAKRRTLTLLLEGELALLVVVLVLSSSAVLTTLVDTAKSAGVFSSCVCGAHTFPLFLGMANVSLVCLDGV